MRKQRAFASLTPSEMSNLFQMISRETYDAVLERCNKPRPEGFGLKISRRPLETLYHRVALFRALNDRMFKGPKLDYAEFEALTAADTPDSPQEVHDAIIEAACDAVQSEDLSPAQLLVLQRIADFPARAALRAERLELDRQKHALRTNLAQHRKEMDREKLQIAKARLRLAETARPSSGERTRPAYTDRRLAGPSLPEREDVLRLPEFSKLKDSRHPSFIPADSATSSTPPRVCVFPRNAFPVTTVAMKSGFPLWRTFFLFIISLLPLHPAATETIMLPMRDGVKLATDIHKRDSDGKFPVILSRSPYNKNGMDPIGTEAIKRGFIFVAQDCRGRFASEGENLPFNLDGPDGFDTIEWVAKQPWCNGKIGTWGGSAVAITQFQMMASGTDKISAQHLTVGAPNLYEVIYIDGLFRKALIEDWLRAAQWGSNALSRWTSHPNYDEYWQERDASLKYANANSPALHIGGYWDIFAQATIDGFVGYQEKGGPKARGKQRLVMGPWAHAVSQEKVGELKFPNAKNPPGNVGDAWRWFEQTLKTETASINTEPAVAYYVIGDVNDAKAPGNVWRTANQWPPMKAAMTKFFLHEDRGLTKSEPGTAKPLGYVYDPLNPVPTVGGIQLTIPAGPMDQ